MFFTFFFFFLKWWIMLHSTRCRAVKTYMCFEVFKWYGVHYLCFLQLLCTKSIHLLVCKLIIHKKVHLYSAHVSASIKASIEISPKRIRWAFCLICESRVRLDFLFPANRDSTLNEERSSHPHERAASLDSWKQNAPQMRFDGEPINVRGCEIYVRAGRPVAAGEGVSLAVAIWKQTIPRPPMGF